MLLGIAAMFAVPYHTLFSPDQRRAVRNRLRPRLSRDHIAEPSRRGGHARRRVLQRARAKENHHDLPPRIPISIAHVERIDSSRGASAGNNKKKKTASTTTTTEC
ncbi:hypothetical protein [Paraburkholderia sp. BR14374]|uniref:hypothetical protein n=1 Tax=Paraburkholderia sp. BR14374 TaxID=3237007 RepID=UPI0034CFCDF2